MKEGETSEAKLRCVCGHRVACKVQSEGERFVQPPGFFVCRAGVPRGASDLLTYRVYFCARPGALH